VLKTIQVVFFFLIISCSNETIYSGKVLNQENFNNLNFKNKETLISIMGMPSYADTITKKYFYYSEKTHKKSIFNKKTSYSYIFVFEFDENDDIISSNVYDLKNKKDIASVKQETSNDLIKRGLIERVFGGIGPRTELPTTP
tara:strand:+ start:462 stop:887 length:426 start_codon:yes stop_codon:yes gene_type:complete